MSPPKTTARSAQSASHNLRQVREVETEWWIPPLKWIAVAVFIAIPVGAPFVQHYAGRAVWTIVVAALPLFIVLVGYHRWRRICPLAFFAQLSDRLKRPGRRVSAWFEERYYYAAGTAFVLSLWLRLIATNGDGFAISAFFALLSLLAIVFGALYTGKTWCNYICPVSFIEKIYTEPHGLRETANSQCTKCTACKKFCPDINEENGYWKEIESRSKKIVYFAFPGLVFAFYFYYYLQSGTWSYYFGGSWTDEPGIIRSAFAPGHDGRTAGFFFLPSMPRAAASILTLLLCALTSILFFTLLEYAIGRWLRRRDPDTDRARVRHVMFALAGFIAFVTFYTFAGAPTLWKLPWVVPHLFLITVVITATFFVVRRLRRTQRVFAEETLARNMIKRWDDPDIKAPKDLHDAFLIHTISSREKARRGAEVLTIYKDAIDEAIADGFVSRQAVDQLESLRRRLQIKETDHEKVMASLDEEEQAMLLEPARHVSAEKNLQLATYAQTLERQLGHLVAADAEPRQPLILQLRRDYRITEEEHRAVLDNLLGGEHELANRLAEEIKSIESASQTLVALEKAPSPTREFLAALLRSRCERSITRLLGALETDDAADLEIRGKLSSSDTLVRQSGVERLRAYLSPALSRQIEAAHDMTREKSFSSGLADMLVECTRGRDAYIRAAALYVLNEHGRATEEVLAGLSADEHRIVRETADELRKRAVRAPGASDTAPGLITIEKMFALRAAPIFSSLGAEELAELARAGVEETYAPDQALCTQGEAGDEVLIIIAGDVRVFRREESDEVIVGTERAGGIIGEMAVLDPAPRAATVLAGNGGARVLRLSGTAFRDSLNTDPTIAFGVMRTLAKRLRAPRARL